MSKSKENVPDTRAGFTNPDKPTGLVDTEKVDEFATGPFSVLTQSVKDNKQVRLLHQTLWEDEVISLLCFCLYPSRS